MKIPLTAATLALLAGSSLAWVPSSLQPAIERGITGNLNHMLEFYPYELLTLVVLIVYIANYFSGCAVNKKIASLWVDANKELFEQQFSQVGINVAGAPEPFELLDEERKNMFKFFASGRVHVRYCMATIETKRRQDLISMLFLNLFWPEKDRVSIDLPIECPAGKATPVCFGLVRKRVHRSMLDYYDDLRMLAKKFKVDGVSDKLVVLSDHSEILKVLLDKDAKAFLGKYTEYIESVHVTDRQTVLRTPLLLRVVFLLPPAKKMEITKEFSVFALKLAQKVHDYKVSPKLESTLRSDRVKYESKREVNQDKKTEHAEKLKKEKEDKWAKMTPKERKKAREVEEKRQRNRMMRKVKMR